MTEQDVLTLAESLEDAAITFGTRLDCWDRAAARDDLRQARTELQDAIKRKYRTCRWTYDDDTYGYLTECGKKFWSESSWRGSGFTYCPFCGNRITETDRDMFGMTDMELAS